MTVIPVSSRLAARRRQRVGGPSGGLVGAGAGSGRAGQGGERHVLREGGLDQVVAEDRGVQLRGESAGQGALPGAGGAGHLDQERGHRAVLASGTGRQRMRAGALVRRGEYPSNPLR